MPVWRAFRIEGDAAAAALDWLHVHADVQGVLEEESAVTVWLPDALPALPFAGLTVRELPADVANQQSTGLEQDRVIDVAPDLWVRPPWVQAPAGRTGIELVVPRGNAFGSGEHDSTQAALRLLHRVWDGSASCGDVGTGSGVLALYAKVRGCRSICACDIEEAAVVAARELLGPDVLVTLGGPETWRRQVDLLIANMTGDELLAAMPAMLAAWSGRGPLVLGGMREHQVESVLRLLPAPPRWREVAGAFRAVALAPR